MIGFEKLFNCLLPNSFKEFYFLNNGGFFPDGSHNRFTLGGFNSIKYGDLPIERLYKDVTDDFENLNQMIPFAYDYEGNLFLLSLKKEDFNCVYIWLLNDEEPEYVSKSFDLFISDLAEDI
ncbi:SMI1/KNR4 family protein [Flavobacterium chungangensis]|uniref:SMI1/KNR4 family protein n=1 Tax=Flavobacterium chungangensis TaxID=2708132 RepID=A0ABV8Z7Q2_9FLAO